jgi:pimeloyl-ACP methyl ester carboxylesterase
MIRANDVDLYYELTGEQGNPMLLTHGAWLDHSSWNAIIPGLSRRFRVITYDRRGHSRSEKVSTQGSYDEDAEDAAALVQQLGLAPVHIVGESGAGAIALKLAAKKPSIFKSLTAHEPSLFGLLADNPTTAPLLAEMMKRTEGVVKLIESGDKAGGASLTAEIVFGPGGWEKLPSSLRDIFIANADTFADERRDMKSIYVDLDGLSRFNKPTMLTLGGKSPPVFRPVVEKLAKTIPRSKVFTLAEAGHTPFISHPEEFVRTLTEFANSSG